MNWFAAAHNTEFCLFTLQKHNTFPSLKSIHASGLYIRQTCTHSHTGAAVWMHSYHSAHFHLVACYLFLVPKDLRHTLQQGCAGGPMLKHHELLWRQGRQRACAHVEKEPSSCNYTLGHYSFLTDDIPSRK